MLSSSKKEDGDVNGWLTPSKGEDGNVNEDGFTSRKGEDRNVNEDGLPQAKRKLEMSMRMAYRKQRGRWKCH